MKNLNMLVWLTQLGLGVALPLVGFVLLGVWLNNSLSWGNWILWICIVLGIVSAIGGLRSALKTMDQLASDNDKKDVPVSFNDHD